MEWKWNNVDLFIKLGGAGLVSGLLMWWIKILYGKWQDNKKERLNEVAANELDRKKEAESLQDSVELLKTAMVGLQHHDLYKTCQTYLDRGYVSTADLNDLDYLFKPYKALGGNGTGELLYNRVHDLEIRKEDTNE